MHSSSADCVLGVARLISSARTTWAMIGPGRNSNSWVWRLKIDRPVTSDGNRSGVNWMRRKLQPRLRATALASIVLPVPGTSSISRWPRHRRATSVRRTSWRLPMMTRSTFAATLSPVSLMLVICLSSACRGWIGDPRAGAMASGRPPVRGRCAGPPHSTPSRPAPSCSSVLESPHRLTSYSTDESGVLVVQATLARVSRATADSTRIGAGAYPGSLANCLADVGPSDRSIPYQQGGT